MSTVHLVPRVSQPADYLTFRVGAQLFGIRAVEVRDVLRRQTIAQIPRAPRQVGGLVNLRGHIVTAINLRVLLDGDCDDSARMSIVVEFRGEPFCFLVDGVGEVLAVAADTIEPNPGSLPAALNGLTRGVVRARHELVLLLDLESLFSAMETGLAA